MKATFASLSSRRFQAVRPLSRILCVALVFLGCLWNSTAALAQIYTTRFEGEECPISEGGRWRNDGLDWTSIRKSHGLAFCIQTGTNSGSRKFDDSYANLSGFPPDQEAWGEAYKTGDPGIGMFLYCDDGRGIGSHTNFGFASFTARGLGASNPSRTQAGSAPTALAEKSKLDESKSFVAPAPPTPSGNVEPKPSFPRLLGMNIGAKNYDDPN